jgi:hypothetical protein
MNRKYNIGLFITQVINSWCGNRSCQLRQLAGNDDAQSLIEAKS